MEESPPATAPLPRSVRWFAPWTWRKRWVAMIAAALLTFYVLAEAPLEFAIVRRYRLKTERSMVHQMHRHAYYPMEELRDVFQPLDDFRTAQKKWLKDTFGQPMEPSIGVDTFP